MTPRVKLLTVCSKSVKGKFVLLSYVFLVNLSCDKVGILPFVAIYTVLNDRVACQHILLYPPTKTELCRSARMNTSVASKCVYFLDHELDQASFFGWRGCSSRGSRSCIDFHELLRENNIAK